jgi:hypothetical protein
MQTVLFETIYQHINFNLNYCVANTTGMNYINLKIIPIAVFE